MSDISPINRPSLASLTPAAKNGRSQPQQASAPTRQSDQVEFSTASRLLSRLSELPDVRTDLISRIRNEIAAGTYETDDKINAAIDNLVSDL